MKFLKNFIKSFILRSDMFAAQPTLRFNGQSSYQTLFGGCLSILLVIGFVAIFSTSFIKVLEKVNVTASLNLQDNPYDQNTISGIRMAIGIKDLDFRSSQRYFNIILTRRVAGLGGPPSEVSIPLSSCNIDDWKDLGDHFQKLFSIYQMEKMLCPSVSQNLTLNGFAGSQQWTTMYVMVQQCRTMPGASYTCYSGTDVRNKFISYFQTNDFFKVNLLMLNTVISPQQEDATKSVLENQIFLTFSNVSGSRGQIKLGRYYIQTDNSIWPISETVEEEGYYIADHQTYTIGLYSTHYVRIGIQKSRTVYEITRQHDKFDEMLSYVGGLFALLFGWIFFFIGSYNEYKYQVAVAQHAFSLDHTGRKIKEDQFGFFTYLKYSLYDWIKSFNIPINWKKMEEIDSAREEANQQMDVRYLMKKIQRFQIINKLLLGEHNLILANLTRPPTLDQVKRLRKITQYYDKVIKVQNEQNLLENIFKITNMAKVAEETCVDNNQSKMAQRNTTKQQQIELDSQDQQIQKQIAQIYRIAQQNPGNQLSSNLVEEVPQSMRDRFTRLKNLKHQQFNLEKDFGKMSKAKVESSFSINQNSTPPNFFFSMIQHKDKETHP